MQAKKVAGRQGPGGWSGEMDPKTRAAAAAANALFIFSTFKPDGKNCRAQVKPYANSQLVIRLCCDFSNARTALLILAARTGYKPIGCIVRQRGNDIRIHTRDILPTLRRQSRPSSCLAG
jgi:hypothetical protein